MNRARAFSKVRAYMRRNGHSNGRPVIIDHLSIKRSVDGTGAYIVPLDKPKNWVLRVEPSSEVNVLRRGE